MIEEITKKHEEAAKRDRKAADEAKALQVKIQKAIERLDHKVSETTATSQILDDNLTGAWTEFFIFDTPDFKDQLLKQNNEIDAHHRFLKRAPVIREELTRQLKSEAAKQIKAKAVENQLNKLLSYRDLKDRLRKKFSESELFAFADIEREISGFEPDLFASDFLPYFAELQAKYSSSTSRILNISAPDIEDAQAVERFHGYWRYEFLRAFLLSKSIRDIDKWRFLIQEMRKIAGDVGGRYGTLMKDFGDVFLPQLQKQNPTYKILELR